MRHSKIRNSCPRHMLRCTEVSQLIYAMGQKRAWRLQFVNVCCCRKQTLPAKSETGSGRASKLQIQNGSRFRRAIQTIFDLRLSPCPFPSLVRANQPG